MYGVFLLVGGLAINVGFWWLLINFFRKRPKKKPALIFAGGFALLIMGGALAPTETVAPKPAVKEEPEVAELSQADKDAEAAAKKQAEAEQAAAANAADEEQLSKETAYYLKEIKTKVDTQMQMYDSAWDELWVPTMNGISDGTVDAYAAYENMKQLEQRYQTLQSSILAIPDEGLSKEHKETMSDFRSSLKTAAMWRGKAADKTQDLIDAGDYGPKAMDEIKVDIERADSEMMNAVVALTTLEMELGVERDQ